MAAPRSRAAVAFTALILILVATTISATPAPAVGTCVTKPDITPIGDLTPGTTGTADTVVSGRTVVSFDVTILGVLPDGIAPGIDFVMIQASGPVIDATGGIVAGMSGSPVTVNGNLAGSISYGMGDATDPTIGGMTPAADILKVMDYPPGTLRPVTLTPELRRAAAVASEAPLSSVPNVMSQLRLPVSVSGLSSRQLQLVQNQMDHRGLPFSLYRGTSVAAPSAPSPSAPVTSLNPGDSFAAVQSYGDVTFGAIGTTTAVCGNVTMAFGHPYARAGKTSLGMNAADIVAVVTDPSQVLGGFKVGTIAETVGTVDQDRLTGVRGIAGQMPTLIPITSHLENLDLATARDGETDVAWPKYLPDIAAYHTMSNLWVVFDQETEGTTALDWTVNGKRQDGSPFTFQFSNMYYSDSDATVDPIWQMWDQLYEIQHNGFEKISFDSVHIDGTITQADNSAEITGVQSASPITPALKDRSTLRVRAGQKITLAVALHPMEAPDTTTTLTYKVPRWASGKGPLLIAGGSQNDSYGYYGYGYGYGSSGGTATSFDDLLAQMAAASRSNDIVVSLFPRHGEPLDQKTYTQGSIITGATDIQLVIVR